MEAKVVVSVITPSFNRLSLIPETVNSVLSQSYKFFEYIIVDDGSTDGTLDWLRSLDDARVKVLIHENHKNLGQAASINKGISNALGKYVVILDSDDLLAPGILSEHVSFLESHTSVGMVYGQGVAIDKSGNILYELFSPVHTENGDPNNLLLDCYIVSPGLCMFRKDTIEKIGFLEESFRAAQDHDFALRVAECSLIAYSGVPAFYYRKHDGAISVNGLETRWRNGFRILSRAIKRYPYKKKTVRKRLAVLNYHLGKVYWSKNKFRSIRYFVLAGVFDPIRAIKVFLNTDNN
ncbi:glycosyltransferase [Marinobacter sp. W-8]|uniref:glycosyltransferase n=1 Tax=Marinobacter sp. W-8 TaxID=3369658 RepID=UPI0037C8C32B